MTSNIPSVTFSNGVKCPILGLGTWKSEPGAVAKAVEEAIDAGYRHIDCAYVYGNEKEVGEGIRKKIEDKTVKREDLFITSKLWNTYHRKNLIKPAIKKSLENLGLAYLDLYLIHWPMAYKDGDDLFPKNEKGEMVYSDAPLLDTWKGMEELVKENLAKSIGVSNFNAQQIDDILKIATVKPVVNQVECHPYLNQSNLIEFCEKNDIKITAYSPLGSPDRPWASDNDLSLLNDVNLAEMAAKYNKSIAQILIRYQIQRGVIVIPKSVTKSRIISNADVFDFEISSEDLEKINSLNCNMRFCALEWSRDHRDYPFKKEFPLKEKKVK